MNKARESVHIAGSGRISGGRYDVIKILGSARVTGDIEANAVKIAGSAKFEGHLKALKVQTAGTCRVAEDLEAGEVKTAGTCTVEGDLRATQFACSGSQRVGGNLIVGSAQISGSCRVGSDVEADRFLSRGRFDIGGLLSADEIKIELGRGGTCRAGEIGGARIEVRSRGPFWEWRSEEIERKVGKVGYKLEKGLEKLRERFGIDIEIGDLDQLVEEMVRLGEKIRLKVNLDDEDGPGAGTLLETRLIEGDEIYLENTHAEVVRGVRVTLGRGCRIGRVEYAETLKVDDEAQVGEREKV